MTMSHGRRRLTALTTSAALTGALLAVPIAAAAPASAADGTTITPNPAYAGEAFEGWGTSLVWFANATGGYPAELRGIPGPQVRGTARGDGRGVRSDGRSKGAAEAATGGGAGQAVHGGEGVCLDGGRALHAQGRQG